MRGVDLELVEHVADLVSARRRDQVLQYRHGMPLCHAGQPILLHREQLVDDVPPPWLLMREGDVATAKHRIDLRLDTDAIMLG